MSSDERHPADFLYQLASAIKAVRDRGGKWNKTADTIQWAHERIERLETELSTASSKLNRIELKCLDELKHDRRTAFEDGRMDFADVILRMAVQEPPK